MENNVDLLTSSRPPFPTVHVVWSWCAFIAMLLVCGGPWAAAQTGNGRVTGTVTDGHGGVLPGATVLLVGSSSGGNIHAVADAAGVFSTPNVPADVYVLTVTMPGFKRFERANITIGPGGDIALGVIPLVPAPGATGVYWVYSSVGDRVFLSDVSRAQLDRSPRWLPSDETTPLSPDAAIESARLALARVVPGADRWIISSVTLRPIEQARGIYEVVLVAPWLGPGPKVTILVLMSGIAIEPTELGPDDVITVLHQ